MQKISLQIVSPRKTTINGQVASFYYRPISSGTMSVLSKYGLRRNRSASWDVLEEKRQDSLILTALWVIVAHAPLMVQLRRLSLGLWKDPLNLVTKLSFRASLCKVSSDTVYNVHISAFIPCASQSIINVDPGYIVR